MTNDKETEIMEDVRRVFHIEAAALNAQEKSVGREFVKTVEAISTCEGKLVFCGMGKAGLIAQKIAATFSSLGKASFFMHPAEASHGDLGMVGTKDLVFLFSKSGASQEVTALLPTLHRMGVKIVAITCNAQSPLSSSCDILLSLVPYDEACGLGLAPTTSTTLMLVAGDALAVAYLKQNKKFDERSFAFFHPGGSLGQKLRLVEEVMRIDDKIAVVGQDTSIADAILEMTRASIGSVLILDENKEILGIFSDGDLRRSLEKEGKLLGKSISGFMKTKPIVARQGQTVEEARTMMGKLKIGELPVVNFENKLLGVLSLKDL